MQTVVIRVHFGDPVYTTSHHKHVTKRLCGPASGVTCQENVNRDICI